VRELERVVQRAVALTDSALIEPHDLPLGLGTRYEELFQPALEQGETLRAFGSRYARLVLHRSRNNKREACRRLGISYHTLQAYLRLAANTDTCCGVKGAGPGEKGPVGEVEVPGTGHGRSRSSEQKSADAEDSGRSIEAGPSRPNLSDGGDARRHV